MAEAQDTTPDSKLLGFYNTLNAPASTTYKSYKQMVEHNLEQDQKDFSDQTDAIEEFKWSLLGAQYAQAAHPSAVSAGYDSPTDIDPMHIHEDYAKDTSVGGNDVINPLWQFNEDDDLIHPKDAFGIKGGGLVEGRVQTNDNVQTRGLGRVYKEMYDTNMQQLEIAFGVPDYQGMANFLNNNTSKDLMNQNMSGDLHVGQFVAGLIGQAVNLAFTFPLDFAAWMEDQVPESHQGYVSEYVKFEPSMYEYYKKVNNIMISLAQGMDLIPSEFEEDANAPKEEQGVVDFQHLYNESDDLPEIFKYNCDIFSLLQKRAQYIAGGNLSAPSSMQQMHENIKNIESTDNVTGWLDKIGKSLHDWTSWLHGWVGDNKDSEGLRQGAMTRFKGAGMTNMNFVRFRVQNADNASESFSNETSESPIGEKLKQAGQKGQEKKWSITKMAKQIPGAGMVESALETLQAFGQGVLPGSGVLDAAKTNAMFDIPEMWTDSSFSKSYSFTLQLRAPYGDPISIFQTIYVPLAMLLAGCLPRQQGKNLYTTPFMVRAYSKGHFSIPYGIIDSMTVKRGDQEFGWTYQGLPTTVEVEFSIKDLTPVLYMGLSDPMRLSSLRANTRFQEYLDTMCGLGMAERYFLTKSIARRAKIALRLGRLKYTTSSYISNKIGLSGFGQVVSSMMPWDGRTESIGAE